MKYILSLLCLFFVYSLGVSLFIMFMENNLEKHALIPAFFCGAIWRELSKYILGDKKMTITIPVWLLWCLGIPLGAFILLCAFIGFLFLYGKYF